MTFPCPAAHPLGKVRHPVQHRMDVGHDIPPIVNDGRPARRAQRDVQHRAVLGDVDLVAAEHGVDTVLQPGLVGELEQQPQSLVGDPVLGIVEIDAGRLCCEPRSAFAVLGKQLPQMDILYFSIVLLEQHPGGPPAQRRHARRLLLRDLLRRRALTGCSCHAFNPPCAFARSCLRCTSSARSTI